MPDLQPQTPAAGTEGGTGGTEAPPAAPAAPAAPAGEPATGTPGESQTPEGTGAPAAPANSPEAPPAAQEGQQNEDDLPAWARQALTKANDEAAKARIAAKNAADAAAKEVTEKLAKALGIVKENEPLTPEQLTEQLNTAQTNASQAQRELAIYKAAAARKLNADELLDSRSFMERVSQIDLNDASALDALFDAKDVAGNPRFKSTPVVPRGGADLGPGGSSAPRIYTSAQLADHDFYMKHQEDILRAAGEGRIRD